MFAFSREILCLADGRRLAYRVIGDRTQGLPFVFLLHGMFCNGSCWRVWSPPSCVLVVLDRPGYGRSTRAPTNPKWTYARFADDMKCLADHLGAATFSVVGHSSGGPNALACAAHLSDRVDACGVLSGDPEYGHPEFPADVQDPFAHCLRWPGRAFRCLGGFQTDLRVERSAYDFDLADIRCPTLIFVGSRDSKSMIAGATFMNKRLPGSTHTVLHDVGHLGIIFPSRLVKMLQEIIAATKGDSHRIATNIDGSRIAPRVASENEGDGVPPLEG